MSVLASPPAANAASNSPGPAPIASGVVTNGHGQADPNGEVYVLAYPDQADLIGKPAGAQIPLTLVGFARTNAQGHYAVTPQSADLMTTNGQHGYVNLQVIAVSEGKEATAMFSVTPSGAGWRVAGGTTKARPSLSFNFATHIAAVTPTTAAPAPPMATTFAATKPAAATAGAVTATASQVPITPMAPTASLQQLRETTQFASAAASASPNVIPHPGGCLIIPGTIFYNLKEHFVTTETYGGHIPETVTEGTNNYTTATLGAAYSATGSTPWSASGSYSITDSLSHSVSNTWSVPYTVYNRVNYRNYSNTCGGTTREPYSFYDLLTNDGGQVGITWQYNCGTHGAGTTWTTASAQNATIGGGVSLGILNVSAQAGYGTSVQLDFHYNVSGEICGNSTSGPINSSLVEADPY